jgi:hypothetical protein
LNLRPSDPQSDALPSCATARYDREGYTSRQGRLLLGQPCQKGAMAGGVGRRRKNTASRSGHRPRWGGIFSWWPMIGRSGRDNLAQATSAWSSFAQIRPFTRPLPRPEPEPPPRGPAPRPSPQPRPKLPPPVRRVVGGNPGGIDERMSTADRGFVLNVVPESVCATARVRGGVSAGGPSSAAVSDRFAVAIRAARSLGTYRRAPTWA